VQAKKQQLFFLRPQVVSRGISQWQGGGYDDFG